jgi:serine/threonine protein phosphatase PrpC
MEFDGQVRVIQGVGPRTEMQDDGCFGSSIDSRFSWLIVCDGIGGNKGGKQAANITVRCLNAYLRNTLRNESQLAESSFMGAGLQLVKKKFTEKIKEDASLESMGCTLCLAVFTGIKCYVFWSGDTRFYLFRSGTCKWDTYPHNFSFDLFRKGILSLEEARVSENSYLTGSINSFSDAIRIDHQILMLQPDDRFVLCTDGIWALFEHPDFIQLLIGNGLSKTVSTLERQLLQYSNDNYLGFIAEFQ